ncbi:MAG: YlxR family protein [Micrococcus sp.]|nr:YlxR family protein [Micrococcus sp.]
MVVDARVASQALIVPDPAQRLPGRGAWVHPTTVCLDQAERRRAIGRALRLRTAADLQEVRAYVEAWQTAVVDADDRQHHRRGAGGQEENRKRV